MVIEALRGAGSKTTGFVHTSQHDFESLFYILLWICIHYSGPENQKRNVQNLRITDDNNNITTLPTERWIKPMGNWVQLAEDKTLTWNFLKKSVLPWIDLKSRT